MEKQNIFYTFLNQIFIFLDCRFDGLRWVDRFAKKAIEKILINKCSREYKQSDVIRVGQIDKLSLSKYLF